MNAVVYNLARHRERNIHVQEDVPPSYGSADWKHVDARIMALGKERAAHEREVCRWLVEAERLDVPKRLGFASLREYAEWRLGLKGRETEERVRVGKALLSLPALDEALSLGKLWWSAVREMTRVVLPETEEAWLAWASGKGVREVEKQVAGRQKGDLPGDRPDPTLVKHRLSFEVRAETIAMFRELQAAIREELGGDVDDDLVLYEMVRRAHGGEDEGRAPYQVAVSRCDSCKLVSIDAAGESFPVDAVVENMIACDAQYIGSVDIASSDASAHVGAESGASPHVGDGRDRREPSVKQRATQTVPKATRRGVVRRERACCAAPGCRNHRHLQVHHVKPRSEGGDHDPRLLLPLCHRHHTAAHDGLLVIGGDAGGGFTFRHADGVAYGQPLDAAALDVAKQTFDILRAMGFKMTEARKLIDAVQRGGAPKTLEAFVQAALRAT